MAKTRTYTPAEQAQYSRQYPNLQWINGQPYTPKDWASERAAAEQNGLEWDPSQETNTLVPAELTTRFPWEFIAAQVAAPFVAQGIGALAGVGGGGAAGGGSAAAASAAPAAASAAPALPGVMAPGSSILSAAPTVATSGNFWGNLVKNVGGVGGIGRFFGGVSDAMTANRGEANDRAMMQDALRSRNAEFTADYGQRQAENANLWGNRSAEFGATYGRDRANDENAFNRNAGLDAADIQAQRVRGQIDQLAAQRDAQNDAYTNALRSAFALNAKDVSINRPDGVPVIQFSNSPRISQLGPQGLEAAGLMNQASLNTLRNPTPMEALPTYTRPEFKAAPEYQPPAVQQGPAYQPPALSEAKGASFWEKLLGGIGAVGTVGGNTNAR